jgi:hypothetical protein
VIEQVARELCQGNEDGLEQVEGHRVVELLETTPLVPAEPDPDAAESPSTAAPPPPRRVRLTVPPTVAVWTGALSLCC